MEWVPFQSCCSTEWHPPYSCDPWANEVTHGRGGTWLGWSLGYHIQVRLNFICIIDLFKSFLTNILSSIKRLEVFVLELITKLSSMVQDCFLHQSYSSSWSSWKMVTNCNEEIASKTHGNYWGNWQAGNLNATFTLSRHSSYGTSSQVGPLVLQFREMVISKHKEMEGKIDSMKVLDGSNPQKPVVRMANLCVVSSHTVSFFFNSMPM